MSNREQTEAGRRLFAEKRYREAIPLLKAAAESPGSEEILWQELVLAASRDEEHSEAADFAREGVHRFPRSDWLWRQLGNELTKCDRLDEAEKALANARTLNAKADWLWRYYAELHKKRKNPGKQIQALEHLWALGMASAYDLNILGIAYHDEKDFGKAVEWYRRASRAERWTAPLFNMGLVFNDPEVSQDADAADAYRRALLIDPNYKVAIDKLDVTKRKLLPLAARAVSNAASLLGAEDYFQFYLSPFEAFAIDDIDDPAEVDAKTVLRAKKRLLSEIELNDGKVGWLGGYQLDRSRALAIEEELLNETKRSWHWEVFAHKPLLRFLTRGEIAHFLYSDDYFPERVLRLWDENPEFQAFLSEPFARQYNVVLGRALERRCLPVVEVLFDGRRWVMPEHDDLCFEHANRRVESLLEVVRKVKQEGEARKVSLREVDDLLAKDAVPDIFNLLPAPFRAQQAAVVGEVRELAVSCYNEHGDSDLSKAILSLCKKFQFKSADLTKRLDEDFKTIEKLIAQERKHETRKQFGKERAFEITKEGIRDGGTFFPAATVKSLRWGITVTRENYSKRFDYVFAVRNDAGGVITASWSITDESKEDDNTKHFNDMVEAALHYLAQPVLAKVEKQLRAGGSVVVGSCTLNAQGVAFQTSGFLFAKQRFVTWADVSIELSHGEMVVASQSNPSIKTAVSIKENDNAVLLPIIRRVLVGGADGD